MDLPREDVGLARKRPAVLPARGTQERERHAEPGNRREVGTAYRASARHLDTGMLAARPDRARDLPAAVEPARGEALERPAIEWLRAKQVEHVIVKAAGGASTTEARLGCEEWPQRGPAVERCG
jgi:hypothetical protein